jgi:YD repeat-containing protein
MVPTTEFCFYVLIGYVVGGAMRHAVRLLVVCSVCCVGVVCLSAGVAGASALAGAGAGSFASPLVGDALLDEGGQRAAAEVVRDSPEAVSDREESRTKFEDENAEQAAKTFDVAFPGVASVSSGGPPQLPSGAAMTGFAGPDVAQVDLSSGEHALIESTLPMASEASPGIWVPVNLGLRDTSTGFEASNPVVPVRIPKRLSEGAQLASVEISLTPVNEHGTPLGGAEASSDGATVFFANTQADSDTIVKPSPLGFDVSTLLRSVASPQQLYYRVGLPQGASLQLAADSPGGVLIVKEGATIATIPEPSAQDAVGANVPVSVSVSGDTLELSVDDQEASYQWPVLVDPEVVERTEELVVGTWRFGQDGGYTPYNEPGLLEARHTGSFQAGASSEGTWVTAAPGYTKLYEIQTGVTLYPSFESSQYEYKESTYAYLSSWLAFAYGEAGERREMVLSGQPYIKGAGLCANAECIPGDVTSGNELIFGLEAVESSKYLEENGFSELVPFGGSLHNPTVYIAQEKSEHSTAAYNTASAELAGGFNNVLYSGGSWLGPHHGGFELESFDGGLGVAETTIEQYVSGKWSPVTSKSYFGTSACKGIRCPESEHEVFSYNSLESAHLANGEDRIRIAAHSEMPESSSSEHGETGEATLKVDNTAPGKVTLSGLPEKEGGGYELGEVEAHLKVEATDGEGTTKSSGVQSIKVGIDGKEISGSSGSCANGPCTASGEWSLNGAEIGVGYHVLTVVATDNAGNVASKEYPLTVYAASPVGMGPGSVNPESGDFALEAGDVQLSGTLGSLAVSRHYDSRNLKEGAEGPLGPQWSISLGSVAELEVMPDGSVLSIGPRGLTLFSVKKGGGFEPPAGDSNLELKYESEYEPKLPAYLLIDSKQGTTTVFTLPAGGKLWMATASKGPLATDTMTDEYKSIEIGEGKVITEPTLEVAPHPNITCTKATMSVGCRALEFIYDEGETGAKGESEGEWGSYKNHLEEVKAIAYSPSAKAVVQTPVAAYEYDKQGRLRAEWDPAISPALKTTYGYDTEGHVTAISAPRQQPWLLHYGTIPGDGSTGRLLSLTRPQPKAGATEVEETKQLKEQKETEKVTEEPKITGTPVLGTRLVVSNGKWSGSPGAYGYQWEDCNATGGACTPILGATNANYTVAASDEKHTLVASVTALNAGGAVSFSTPATVVVGVAAAEYSLPAGSEPSEIALGSDGNLWYTAKHKIGRITTSGTITEWTLPEGGSPVSITPGPDGNLWYTDAATNKIGRITTAGVITEYAMAGQTSSPGGITAGTDGALWYTDLAQAGKRGIGRISTSGEVSQPKEHGGESPKRIVSGSDGKLWFSLEQGPAGSIGTMSTSWSSFGESNLATGSEPFGITSGPDGNLWATDPSANKIDKVSTSGSVSEYSLPAGSEPQMITTGPDGNLWYTDKASSKIGKITTAGSVSEYSVTKESQPNGITQGPDGDIWYTDKATSKIAKIPVSGTTITEGEAKAPQPNTTTVEYHVPLTGGTGLTAMTPSEVAKWAQKDDPIEAAAIFPPTKPTGWPATEYQGATVYYLDSQARTVDVAGPSGGISTTEYNEDNAITRSLSAANHATAMKEAKPAEAAELLDTKSAYNASGQLTDTWGPQHTVKLAAGKEGKKGEEVLARNHIKYFYNEGAKEVEEKTKETYDLVTKTIDGAETANKEEFDKRTATTSYNAQNNLGWKLRKATSTTTEPAGVDLTTSTKYEEATGNLIETSAPATEGKDTKVAPAYSAGIGSRGTAAGEFERPEQVAVDASNNLWVTDTGNSRIEKFTATGTFIEAIGFGVSNGETKLETCTSSCRAGISGSANEQFAEPIGIAIASGDIYIADYKNDRIDVFNEKGEYVTNFGTKGTGSGQLQGPWGLAFDESGDLWISDQINDRVDEFTKPGVFMKAMGFGVSNGADENQTCSTSCKAGITGSKSGQLGAIADIAFAGSKLYVTDWGNEHIDIFNANNEYAGTIGSEGTGNGEFKEASGITTDPANGDLLITDLGNDRVQEMSTTGTYLYQFGAKGSSSGQFLLPEGIAANTAGEIYVVDLGNRRVQHWVPSVTGNPGAHSTKTSYYTAKAESEIAACQNHPEWAGLPCQTRPAAQPGIATSPELPVTTITGYNMWNQAETTLETFEATEGSKKTSYERTKKNSFDGAGRPVSTEETSTSSADKALPKVTDKYNSESGELEEVSSGEPAKTLISHYNTLGQLTSYTEAAGKTTKYSYYPDGLIKEVSDGSEEGKGKQTYSYEEATGELTRLVDSAAGTFGATYDIAGRMTSESYPNGMTAYYTYNSAGTTTEVRYKKISDCTEEYEKCVWFKDHIVPSIHGETLKQTSTLAEEPNYSYDAAGRLTEAQEIPAGEGCKTRIYSYDEDNNRTSLTQREPGSEGKCATEGGTTEWHTYDTGDRLTDPGVTYDPLGNTTKLPATDAGGTALTSSYYVDNQLYTQIQGEKTIEYTLDPDDRTYQTKATSAATVTNHYDGPGNALAWTSEPEGWTREIPGIGGELAALQTNTTAPKLQLHDLQGNIVATAALSETETKLLTKYNSTEFGVPTTKEQPPKYAWLGASGLSSELISGTVTQDGVTYVPETGRQLQTQPVELPLPVNNSNTYQLELPPWTAAVVAQEGTQRITEAEEARKARETAVVPAGAIPYPGEEAEGGGGFYDPEGLASYHQTYERARELRIDAVACDTTVGIITEGDLSCGAYTEQLTASATNLEECAAEKKEHPWGVCYIHETRKEDGLGDSIPWSAEAELCTYALTVRGKNIYYCAGQQFYVWGPWF